MATFDEDTRTLKLVITKVKKSGKNAWEAGGKLDQIKNSKNFKPKYEKFKDYVKSEFNLTESTAEQYIKVYQQIPFDMITENMLVSHLYTIAEMEDALKKQVLQVMKLSEQEKLRTEVTNQNIQTARNTSKLPYDGDAVLIFKQIVESAKKSLSDETVRDIFRKILNNESERKKRAKKNPLDNAISIESLKIHSSFSSVPEIYRYTPISEQGLVGLFCTIFHLIKKITFDYKYRKYSLTKIIYIRTEFPDAKIEVSECLNQEYRGLTNAINQEIENKNEKDLDIEFERDSFNYWRHKHHEADEKCDMIICWEIDKNFENIDMNMPLILSIKELLQTGEIVLHGNKN